MKGIFQFFSHERNRFITAAVFGLIVTLVVILPYIIMGENSYLIIHDQLDDNFPETVNRADQYFSDINSHDAHYVDGSDSVGIFPMRIIYKAIYAIFAPFTAYVINYAFIIYVGFMGMYLLMDKLLVKKGFLCSLIAASLICFVRLYQDFGLSALGIPLLTWAFLSLHENNNIIISYVCIALFVIESSLVISGYLCIGIAFLWLIVELLLKRNHPIKGYAKEHKHFIIAVIGMLGLYCLLNYPTFINVFFGAKGGAQRAVQAISSMSFTDALKNGFAIFRDGQYHAGSSHTYIMQFAVVAIPVLFAFWKCYEKKQRQLLVLCAILFGTAVFIGAFYGIFRLGFVVSIRRKLGALGTFQFDRLYFLYPALWCTMAGILLYIISWLICSIPKIFEKKNENASDAQRGFFAVLSCIVCVIFAVSAASSMTKLNTEMQMNIRNVSACLSGKQPYISGTTFSNFYAEDIFDDIEDCIAKPKDTYRVVSLGMYPSIAYFNGFDCCDGYTPTYSLDYKADFRKVIAGELDKDEDIKEYFDGWGSRCYMFCSELGKSYMYTKSSTVRAVDNLNIDTEALSALGCEYIISAVEIKNAQDLGIKLEKVFDNTDGIWQIYLYKI